MPDIGRIQQAPRVLPPMQDQHVNQKKKNNEDERKKQRENEDDKKNGKVDEYI